MFAICCLWAYRDLKLLSHQHPWQCPIRQRRTCGWTGYRIMPKTHRRVRIDILHMKRSLSVHQTLSEKCKLRYGYKRHLKEVRWGSWAILLQLMCQYFIKLWPHSQSTERIASGHNTVIILVSRIPGLVYSSRLFDHYIFCKDRLCLPPSIAGEAPVAPVYYYLTSDHYSARMGSLNLLLPARNTNGPTYYVRH